MSIFSHTVGISIKKRQREEEQEKRGLWAAQKQSKVECSAIVKRGDPPTPKPACGVHQKVPAWGQQKKSRREE